MCSAHPTHKHTNTDRGDASGKNGNAKRRFGIESKLALEYGDSLTPCV